MVGGGGITCNGPLSVEPILTAKQLNPDILHNYPIKKHHTSTVLPRIERGKTGEMRTVSYLKV